MTTIINKSQLADATAAEVGDHSPEARMSNAHLIGQSVNDSQIVHDHGNVSQPLDADLEVDVKTVDNYSVNKSPYPIESEYQQKKAEHGNTVIEPAD